MEKTFDVCLILFYTLGMNNDKAFGLRLPVSDYEKLVIIAMSERTTVAQIVRRMIARMLEEKRL